MFIGCNVFAQNNFLYTVFRTKIQERQYVKTTRVKTSCKRYLEFNFKHESFRYNLFAETFQFLLSFNSLNVLGFRN